MTARQRPEDLDRALRPDGPLTEQPAGKVRTPAVAGRRERREQVGHDRVVISRVKRHVLAPALRKRRRDVERSVAVEWRDFDRDHTFDVQEATPEVAVQDTSTDGRLQIEADDRDHRRDAAAVIQHLALPTSRKAERLSNAAS